MNYNIEKLSPVVNLLYKLQRLNIVLWLKDGGKIGVFCHEAISEDIKEQIQKNREEILEILKNNKRVEKYNLPFVFNLHDKIQKIPLSFQQESLFFINEYNRNSDNSYSEMACIFFDKNLNIGVLEKTLNHLIERHSVFRTIFRKDENGVPYQMILPFDDKLRVKLTLDTVHENLDQYLLDKNSYVFDFNQELLLKCDLVETIHNDDKVYILCVTVHHIVIDGVSFYIFIKECHDIYEKLLSNTQTQPILPIQGITYADYAIWQRSFLNGEVLQKKLDYWNNKLSGFEELQLPLDMPRSSNQPNIASSINVVLDGELSNKIKKLSECYSLSVFQTLLAGFYILLNKYTNQTDIVIGSTSANRNFSQIENIIGLFVNMLVFRIDIKDMTIAALLKEVKETCLEASAYNDTPFELVVRHLKVERDPKLNPIFQIVFTQGADIPKSELMFNQSINNSQSYKNARAKFDLVIYVSDYNEKIGFIFEFNTSLFQQKTIDHMIAHYKNILTIITKNTDGFVERINILSPQEYQQVIYDWNQTDGAFPSDKIISQLFEEQVKYTPDRVVAVFEQSNITYDELNKKSNKLANYLRNKHKEIYKKEFQPDTLIALYLDRGFEMLIGILGVLKAGGAYVPLDPDYPSDRLEFIINDAAAKFTLTQDDKTDKLHSVNKNTLVNIKDFELFCDEIDENPKIINHPASLAYVIYTSGSTGNPKGVMVEHRALINRLFWMQKQYKFCYEDVVLQKTPYTFDISIWELIVPLISGGKLVFAIPNGHKDPFYLVDLIKDKSINTVHFVPSMLEPFLQAVKDTNPNNFPLKQIFCSGEALLTPLVNNCLRVLPGVDVHNLYGPTEAAIDVSFHYVDPKATYHAIPIGKPISNIKLYILDKFLKPKPIGIIGDLYIGGVGLARGYLNRDDLTFKSFIPSPFIIEDDKSKEPARIYRTGDLAKWLPDGGIEYIGRNDFQVKIRGFRVELGEIELQLLKHDAVSGCVVRTNIEKQKNIAQIIAYYVPNLEYAFTVKKIVEYQKNGGNPISSRLYELPSGLSLYSYNKSELEFLYDEIFVNSTYTKYGITIPEGGCVFDVGANLGMFSIYACLTAKNVKVYSFEPVPQIFELLSCNASLFQKDIKTFAFGFSDKEEKVSFTYYPKATILSGRYANIGGESETLKRYLKNNLKSNLKETNDDEINDLLGEVLQQQHVEVKLKTISQFIYDNNIERIDLLKIDVEKCERAVLDGIIDSDWTKIKQIVLEVHNGEFECDEIKHFLKKRHFEVFCQQSADLSQTNIYNIYAFQKDVSWNLANNDNHCVKEWFSLTELNTDLKHYLENFLPHYMIPDKFIALDTIPLTINGKIDRKSLPEPEFNTDNNNYIPPQNDLHEIIRHVWSEVLEIPENQISINDSFFKLGGNSILSMQLQSKLKKTLKIAHLQISDLFKYIDIKSFSDYLLSNKSVDKAQYHIQKKMPKIENDVAIIGYSGAFTGGESIDDYWQQIIDGKEGYYKTDKVFYDKNFIPVISRVKGIEEFDANFWNIPPNEAELADPQIRKFLEHCWNVLEKAGYSKNRTQQQIGVFAGPGDQTYLMQNILQSKRSNDFDFFSSYTMNGKDFLATRVSYYLGLTGPAININTACSTSLITIIEACKSLVLGNCNLAIAGGVSLILLENDGYVWSEGMVMSKQGQCRAFDENADGIVRGAGVGVVLLKRLSDALKDHDDIKCIIKGYAVNNDGNRKTDYVAPSVSGQIECILNAQHMANITSDQVDYVECHGTGTKIGDPIEISALKEAFAINQGIIKNASCIIGSVKSNIGHADSAAGVASVIKVTKMLENNIFPKQINYTIANSELFLEQTPFKIITEQQKWENNKFSRIAGISSFGIGGTNAHLILEEASAVNQKVVENNTLSRPYLLSISAKSSLSLDESRARLSEYLKVHDDADLANVAFTLHTTREEFCCRQMFLCENINDAIEKLQDNCEKYSPIDCDRNEINKDEIPSVVFLCSGIGEHYLNMGKGLYEKAEKFRQEVDRCCEITNLYLEKDLREVLFRNNENNAKLLEQTKYMASAVFIMGYALAKLWMRLGIEATALIGHSTGEYLAACLAGVLSLEDMLRLVVKRAEIIDSSSIGAMLAVPLSEAEILPLLEDGLSIASVNGPSLCVVSGENSAIEKIEKKLDASGSASSRLPVTIAYHSEIMKEKKDALLNLFKTFNFEKPLVPYISNLTGKEIKPSEATSPEYWYEHTCKTVHFSNGIKELLNNNRKTIFIEIGPGRNLASAVLQHQTKNINLKGRVFSSIRNKDLDIDDYKFLLSNLGKLWLQGIKINWNNFYDCSKHLKVELPTYAFDKTAYWIKPDAGSQPQTVTSPNNVTRYPLDEWFVKTTWEYDKVRDKLLITNGQKYLIFVDSNEISNQVVDKIKQSNVVYTVKRGKKYSLNETNKEYTIREHVKDDYVKLAKSLGQHNLKFDYFIHLWMLDSLVDSHDVNSASVEYYQQIGFYSILYAIQVITENSLTDSLRLTIITNGIYSLTDDEVLYPEKATALGLVKCIPFEYPSIVCKCVDIDSPIVFDDVMINNILIEITQNFSSIAPDLDNNIIAYRKSFRWVRKFTKVNIKNLNRSIPILKDGGVYIVTGGLGGIGSVLAENLAEKAKNAKIVLIGRTKLPEKSFWANYIENNPTSKTVMKLNRMLVIEKLGCEVHYIQADISNLKDTCEAFNHIRQTIGPINGLIHSAGLPPDQAIYKKNKDYVENIFASKVFGTVALQKALADDNLDFFFVCSSLSSLVGAFAEADYAGANAFQDAFAHYLDKHYKSRIFAVNWALWKEVGFAVDLEVPEIIQEQRKLDMRYGISNQEGKEVFNRVINQNEVQLALIPYVKNNVKTDEDINVKRLHPRPKLTTEYAEPKNATEKIIEKCWQKVLGFEKIGVHDNFFDLGGNSLSALRIINEINKSFDQKLTPSFFLDNSSIYKIARYLLNAKKEKADGILVKLKAGSETPIFLIHPIGGDVMYYKDFSEKYPGENSVYGIRDQGWLTETSRIEISSIEEMAVFYLRRLREIQSNGPYIIGGSSFGGMVAYEMANNLIKAGEEVVIFMVDSPGPKLYPAKLASYIDVIYYLLSYERNEVSREVKKQLEKYANDQEMLIEYIVQHKLFGFDDKKLLKTGLDIFTINQTLMYNYTNPTNFLGEEVLFFKAMENNNYIPKDIEKGWGGFITSTQLKLFEISGNHTTMNNTPNVEKICKIVKSYVDKLLQK
ncbi:MAG: amino acid adenylation domain-containing protein [Gammaproteobacteria bacterium]|nr:amino acid adenylation domain-containing protein [Gammaproteobacteria bacterium]